MSSQNRTTTSSQLSPVTFVQPAPPISSTNIQQTGIISSSTNFNSFISPSSVVYHRNPPRDPFLFSSPPTAQFSTLPGSGGLFLTPSVNSHTGFTPARIGSTKTETVVMKPPKPPEKPLMPYMRYSRRMWDKVRTSNPDSKLWDIGKIIGQMWRELPESARQVYIDEYEAEKLEYDKAMKAYHNSPAYQAYLLSKNKGRSTEKQSSGTTESGVFIQPLDEDEDMGQFSYKQLAASRFHRNHRLMKEIFGETQVPDARNVITAQRLGVLKKQVNSLTLHQNKLEEELKQLEVRFESKKRKMAESSDQFTLTWKKICSQKPDPYEELVERSKAYLLNAYEQYKIQEQKQKEALANQQAAQMQTESLSFPSSNVQEEYLSNSESDQNKLNQEASRMLPVDDSSISPQQPKEQLQPPGSVQNQTESGFSMAAGDSGLDQRGSETRMDNEFSYEATNDSQLNAGTRDTSGAGSLEREESDDGNEMSTKKGQNEMEENQQTAKEMVTSPGLVEDNSENSQEA